MRELIPGLLAAALLAASQIACGGGGAKMDDASSSDASRSDGVIVVDGRILPDGPSPLDLSHPGDFIAADVDGVTVRAELMPSAGTKGLSGPDQIWMSAGTTSATLGWSIYVMNSVGTSTCIPDWVSLFEVGRMLRSDRGSCSVTIASAAPALGDVIEGTFTATLTTLDSPQQYAVTNGAFHVTRNFE
jgi:hypothetical protein